MTVFFSAHARERAKERYGLDLSVRDLSEILRACRDGRASMMQSSENGEIFVWRWQGQVILPVVRSNRQFIVTFQPKDYFTAGHHKARRLTKTTTGTAGGLYGREPARKPSKRAMQAMIDEDGWVRRRNLGRIEAAE